MFEFDDEIDEIEETREWYNDNTKTTKTTAELSHDKLNEMVETAASRLEVAAPQFAPASDFDIADEIAALAGMSEPEAGAAIKLK